MSNPAHSRSPNGFKVHHGTRESGPLCSKRFEANCSTEIHSVSCLRCLVILHKQQPRRGDLLPAIATRIDMLRGSK